jgi:hypothetical protein
MVRAKYQDRSYVYAPINAEIAARKPEFGRYLSQQERIVIADAARAGLSGRRWPREKHRLGLRSQVSVADSRRAGEQAEPQPAPRAPVPASSSCRCEDSLLGAIRAPVDRARTLGAHNVSSATNAMQTATSAWRRTAAARENRSLRLITASKQPLQTRRLLRFGPRRDRQSSRS